MALAILVDGLCVRLRACVEEWGKNSEAEFKIGQKRGVKTQLGRKLKIKKRTKNALKDPPVIQMVSQPFFLVPAVQRVGWQNR